MNKKKVISIILGMCISLSFMNTSAFAAESYSGSFEQAILNVKSVVSISDDYKNFSHSSREITDGSDTITVWDLEWESDDDKDGYISAEVDSYGNICSYTNYKYNGDSFGLANVSRENAKVVADDFLKKIIPDYCTDMRLVDGYNDDSYSDEYTFIYQQYVDDIPVDFIRAVIGINKYSEEVEYYSGVEPGTKKMDYNHDDNIIDIETAKRMYKENIQSDLSYYSTYDYKLKKNNLFAMYSFGDNKAIDAKTGETVNIYNSGMDIYSGKDFVGNTEAVSDSGNGLSEVEKEEVNNVSGLISKEKAQEIINENSEILSKMKIEDIALNKSYIGSNYIWNINYDGGYAEVNASTGELLGFYIYSSSLGGGSSVITADDAKNKAEALLKKLTGNKFNETRLLEDYNGEDEGQYEFNYIRQINGKDYFSNRLTVSIDKSTGNIVSYNSIWYDNVTLPDVSQAITKDDAFNIFNESEHFGLHYIINENNETELVYNFSEADRGYFIDALSGKKIDRWGDEYKYSDIPKYSDIQGHWCEKTVNELLDNGYYIPGDKFNPDSNITQINFFKYMLSPEIRNYSEDEMYNMLIDRGIIKKEERNALGAVTNKEAAKFITRYLGYEKLAQNSKIFNSVFNDEIDDEYLGYADICYGLGVIKGDSKGCFNENRFVSNAKAASYIYNIVSQNNSRYIK